MGKSVYQGDHAEDQTPEVDYSVKTICFFPLLAVVAWLLFRETNKFFASLVHKMHFVSFRHGVILLLHTG